MSFHKLFAIAICSAALGGATTAYAQPIFSHAESLEYIAANADLIVVGKLAKLREAAKDDEREGRRVKIAVQKTLKGDHAESADVRLSNPAAQLLEWKDKQKLLLVALRYDAAMKVNVFDLTKEKLEVITSDFTILHKPEDVIRVVKETVQRMPGVRRTFHVRFLAPNDRIAGTRYANSSGLYLTVPVDERLQKRARELVRSGDYWRRNEGVRALRYFQSDANIATLKSLLEDPGWGYVRHAVYNLGVEVRRYGVREEAYQVLKNWGVEVEKPMLREEVYRPEKVTIVHLARQPVVNGQLKKLARFENLRLLYLDETEVTDESLKELHHLKKLSELSLARTKITDNGLKQLAELKNLRYLNVVRTKVTAAGIAELRKHHPKLKIDHSSQ